MTDLVRVDYAGPGGACLAIESLGIESYGIEWEKWACATRAAAGLRTIRADLATYRPGGHPWGYWGSPPCQTMSMAGNGEGRKLIPQLIDVIDREAWEEADLFDYRTRHVIDSARVAVTCGAEWIAMEQVPAVLPVWEALCKVLERHGYSTWAMKLNAADYGVPQTRKRAILGASRVRLAEPPSPTHSKEIGVQPLFEEPLKPWVSMADALGWGFDVPSATVPGGSHGDPFANANYRKRLARYAIDRRQQSDGVPVRLVPFSEPAPALDTQVGSKWVARVLNPEVTPTQPNRRRYSMDEPAPTIAFGHDSANWCWEMPAATVAGDPRITARCFHEHGTQGRNAKTTEQVRAGDCEGTEPVKLTIQEAMILQSFPVGHPVQGPKSAQFLQIGNAAPVKLAQAVVASLTGRSVA